MVPPMRQTAPPAPEIETDGTEQTGPLLPPTHRHNRQYLRVRNSCGRLTAGQQRCFFYARPPCHEYCEPVAIVAVRNISRSDRLDDATSPNGERQK